MKKLILLCLVLPLFIYGQQTKDQSLDFTKQTPTVAKIADNSQQPGQDNTDITPHAGTTRAPQKTEISSSGNAYTLIMSESHCLTANDDLNVIMFTHRGNPGVVGTDVGDIFISTSYDGGTTWNSQLVLAKTTAKANRYPSGIIYNPTGNTTADQAYAVYCGPSHDDVPNNSTWDRNYFGSMRLDGQNNDYTYVANPPSPSGGIDEILIRMQLSSCDDGNVHVFAPSSYYEINKVLLDSITRRYVLIKNGAYNSSTNSFDWTEYKLKPDFYVDSSSPTLKYENYGSYGMAWSQDGTVGYVYMMNRDSANDNRSLQPIVYKSTDAGQSWTKMPVFDFSTLTDMTDHMREMRQGGKRPHFMSEHDAVVDANGNLHIFSLVRSGSSDHEDSLGYSWIFPQQLFDVYTTSGGGWGAELIDTISSDLVSYTESWYGSGSDAMGWDHRIQASRTTSGDKVFVIWSDTDPDNSTINEYPDIIGFGKDVNSSDRFPVTNFTKGTPYEADNYFHFVSNITMVEGTNYRIPVTTEILGSTPLQPVTHQYFHNIGWGDFNSIEKTEIMQFSVSSIYPNPVEEKTNLNIRMKKPGDITVNIIDIAGKTITDTRYSNLSASTHTFEIDCSEMNSGIYFVEISDGVSRTTQKMIVR